MEKLFQNLKKEIKRDYGFTKKTIPFIPFEKWRGKLQTYPKEFEEEYSRNISFLKKRLGLTDLQKIKNPRKKLILFVGIPGAGKTTLANIVKNSIPNTILLRGHDIVDMLGLYGSKIKVYKERLRKRGFKYPDPWYISYLYQEELTQNCLNLGYNVVFDDNIRTRKNRLGYSKLAKNNDAKIVFIQINASFGTYLKREEGKINNKKLKFLANFVFQSDDITKNEAQKYDILINVDGTSQINEIRKVLMSQIKKLH